jgi:hypothetical protein
MCAASCGDDTESIRKYNRRVRINSFVIGETGLAKSPMLRRIVGAVPGSVYESMQNTTTKSLTCIVSKEGGDSPVIRLGPAPLAKEAILAANELGRTSAEDDLSQLLDVLEEGKFSVNKYGFRISDIHSPTVVIASANPKIDRTLEDGSGNGKFNINDMGIIRPIIDRFDLIFVLKTQRDKQYLKEYNKQKNKWENMIPPNYTTYLEKHLLYCRRINPTVSPEAQTILSGYYEGIAQKSGSPRLKETLFRCVRMAARLKLKSEADENDAFEVCNFMNQILADIHDITSLPASPKDYAFKELLYKLEAHQEPISLQEHIAKVCFSDDYIDSYIGPNHSLRDNKKLRNITKMLLEHPQVRKLQLHPIVIQRIPKTGASDLSDSSDPKNTILQPKKSSEITSDTVFDESVHAQPIAQKTTKKNEGVGKIRSPRSPRSHDGFDTNKVKIVNLMKDNCDILIGRKWLSRSKDYPLAGMSGYLGNPYTIVKSGKELTEPWECKNREEPSFSFYSK